MPWPAGAEPIVPQNATPPAEAQQEPSMLSRIGNFAGDVGKGLGESAISLMSTGDNAIRKIPHVGEFLTTPITGTPADKAIQHTHELATPANRTQTVSKGIGDAAQFMIPGGAEDTAARMLPGAAQAAGRIGLSALSAGGVNAAQGGGFGTGAAAGAAGGALGAGLKAAAPKLAEAALGITKTDRAFGKTPGNAILNETRGIRPETIAESGQTRLNELTPQLERAAAASSTPADLAPARNVIADAANKASLQNAGTLHGQIQGLGDTLSKRFDTGAPIPQQVSPSDLLNLKRGFSEEHLGRWNPETHSATIGAGRNAYRAMDAELDRTVPEAAGLNQRISSLIPVARRAESVSRGAPTLQRALGRFGAHTGALTLGGVGGMAGYREGGVPGAVAGGLTGVLAPELIASPEGQMAIARTLNKLKNLRPAVGAALQANRNREDQ